MLLLRRLGGSQVAESVQFKCLTADYNTICTFKCSPVLLGLSEQRTISGSG
jgi:hypothetical protein